jgi:peptidoglycan hydrolase-like protein with peptidoglycan-binding domain
MLKHTSRVINASLLVVLVGLPSWVLAATPRDFLRHHHERSSPTATQQKSPRQRQDVLRRVSRDDRSQDQERVETLQRALQACGYYLGCRIDGWFGPYTQMAVMEFQRDNRLPITGVVPPSLFEQILAKAGRQTDEHQKPTAPEATSPASSGPSAVPSSLRKYLQPTPHAPSTNSQIKAKAAALTGPSPRATLQNIFAFAQKIRYAFYYNSQKGALGTLQSMRANCCDKANLIVALCRAAGIPARYGHSPDCRFRSGLRCGHVWAYAWVDGKWLPLDSTSRANAVGRLNSFTPLASVRHYRELPF